MQQVSDGVQKGGNAIRQVSGNAGTPTSMDIPTDTVLNLSQVQYQGVVDYVGLIQRGANTSSIETAITAAR